MRRAAPTLHGGAPRSPGQSRLRPESRARHVVQTVLRRDRGRGRGPTTPVRAGAAWSITGISSRMPRSACMTTATVTPQPELDGRLLHLSRVASCAQPSSLAARGGAPPRISDHRGLHRTRRGKGDSIVGGDVGDAAGTVTATSGVTACRFAFFGGGAASSIPGGRSAGRPASRPRRLADLSATRVRVRYGSIASSLAVFIARATSRWCWRQVPVLARALIFPRSVMKRRRRSVSFVVDRHNLPRTEDAHLRSATPDSVFPVVRPGSASVLSVCCHVSIRRDSTRVNYQESESETGTAGQRGRMSGAAATIQDAAAT